MDLYEGLGWVLITVLASVGIAAFLGLLALTKIVFTFLGS